MPVTVAASIGTPLRQEGTLADTHRQTAAAEHALENGILLQQQLIVMQLQGDVTIAEVIGRLQKLQC